MSAFCSGWLTLSELIHPGLLRLHRGATRNSDTRRYQRRVSCRLQRRYRIAAFAEGWGEGLVSVRLSYLRPVLCPHIRSGEDSIGRPAFFGSLIVWCASPPQHAYVVLPEYEYNPKPTVEGATTWSKTAPEWTTFAGQQRELFYVDGENISYAGTFICHTGPQGVNIAKLGNAADEVRFFSSSQLPKPLLSQPLDLDAPRCSRTKDPPSRHQEPEGQIQPLQDLHAASRRPLPGQLWGSDGAAPRSAARWVQQGAVQRPDYGEQETQPRSGSRRPS